MKKFLAIYLGTPTSPEKVEWDRRSEAERRELEARALQAWFEWGTKYRDAIVDMGAPLGKTKRAARDGISDVSNAMVGYAIVQAESHEAAARMFENHPHFSIFPGEGVEIMECLPLPKQ